MIAIHRATILSSFILIMFFASAAQAQSVEAPVIQSIARSPIEDGAIEVRGTATPQANLFIEVVSSDAGSVFSADATSGLRGEWNISIPDTAFPAGAYTLRATAYVGTLASAPAEARGYKVRPQPLLAIKGVEFEWTDFLMLFILIALAAIGGLGWHHERARRKREVYASIAERDITNMCSLLVGEVDRLNGLLKGAKGIEPHVAAEADYLIKNEKQTLEKMQGYLAAGIRKLS